MNDTKERLIELLAAGQAQIAQFARQMFAEHGRGVVLFDVPALVLDGETLIASELGYQPESTLRAPDRRRAERQRNQRGADEECWRPTTPRSRR